MTLDEFPDIDAAWERHCELERTFRRQAFLDRAFGRDAEPNIIALEEHHRAARALMAEVVVPDREVA